MSGESTAEGDWDKLAADARGDPKDVILVRKLPSRRRELAKVPGE